jgi:hypothetical protein
MKVEIYNLPEEIEDNFSYSLEFNGLSQTEITWLSMLLHKEHVENNSPRALRIHKEIQKAIDKNFQKD